MMSKELIRQIKKFLNSEKQTYIATNSELIISLNGLLYLITTSDTSNFFTHNAIIVKVNTLREFIDFYRGNR